MEVRHIGVQIYSLWNKLIGVICSDIKIINGRLKKQAIKKFEERLSRKVITHKITTSITEKRDDSEVQDEIFAKDDGR